MGRLIIISTFVLGASFFALSGQTLGVESKPVSLLPPTNFSAKVLSSSYAELSWLPSKSGTEIAGYYIYRDDFRLNRTNELSYLDQSLSADTIYHYYLTTYDSSGRESASTSILSVKTLALPKSPEVGNPKSKSVAGINGISNFKVLPIFEGGKASLLVNFDTNSPALASISYGPDLDNSSGIINGVTYLNWHSYLIDDLSVGSDYYLTLRISPRGLPPSSNQFLVSREIFASHQRPHDIIDLTAQIEGSEAHLSWKNSPANDFENIYVVRSTKFYPESRFSGLPMWQGRDNNYVDRSLESNKNYYYGVFACNKEKLCSPGSYLVLREGRWGEAEKSSSFISTTTVAVAWRHCEQKTILSRTSFLLTAPDLTGPWANGLYLARLFRGNKILATYKLIEDNKSNFTTSELNLSTPGIYRYELESYDIYGSNLRRVSCGEITVIEPEKEKNFGQQFINWINSILW